MYITDKVSTYKRVDLQHQSILESYELGVLNKYTVLKVDRVLHNKL